MLDRERIRGRVRHLFPVLAVLWVGALIPAAGMLLKYEWKAGAMAPAPARLAGAELGQAAGADRTGLLIVAIHPLCSCTRATLEELESAAAEWKEPYRAQLLIYSPKNGSPKNETPNDGTSKAETLNDGGPRTETPKGGGDTAAFDWRRSESIVAAQRALHADVVMDEGGAAAGRLGALTSGEVLYYSAANEGGERRLLFSGGVTGGRGMVGENGGIDALTRAVERGQSGQEAAAVNPAHAAVYGCGLSTLAAQAALTAREQAR